MGLGGSRDSISTTSGGSLNPERPGPVTAPSGVKGQGLRGAAEEVVVNSQQNNQTQNAFGNSFFFFFFFLLCSEN